VLLRHAHRALAVLLHVLHCARLRVEASRCQTDLAQGVA
jgi:hypothetical protein